MCSTQIYRLHLPLSGKKIQSRIFLKQLESLRKIIRPQSTVSIVPNVSTIFFSTDSTCWPVIQYSSQWSWVKNFSSIPNEIISISTKNLLTSCFPKKEEEEFYTPFRKSKIYSHFKMPSPQICSVDLLKSFKYTRCFWCSIMEFTKKSKSPLVNPWT